MHSKDREELRRLRHKVDNIRGPHVQNRGDSVFIAAPPTRNRGGERGKSTPGFIKAWLVKTGGSDGNSATNTPASWTYTAYADAAHTTILATDVPYSLPYIFASKTNPAGFGYLDTFGAVGNGPYDDMYGVGNAPSGSGGSGSSSPTKTPYRLIIADHTFGQANVCSNLEFPGSSTGSGS